MTKRGCHWPLLFLALLWHTFSHAQDILSLVPAQGELNGWKISTGPATYPGDQLYELINGGADIYYEYGFVQVVSVRFTDPSQNLIQLEIYEMSDPVSAYGIFSLTQQTTAWDRSFGNISAVKTDYIAFWKGPYYVNVSWASRQHQNVPPLQRVASLVDRNIKVSGEFPELVLAFGAEDLNKKTVLLNGNLALSNFYYFDYKDIFEIREGIACTRDNHHRIVIRYPDVARAQSVLTSARQSISANKRFTDVAMSFQGFTCKDNKGNRMLIRQSENYLVIIVGLNATVPLVPLMDEITYKIEDLH